MSALQKERQQLRAYGVVLALFVVAFAVGLANGLARGHWFTFGLFANGILGISWAALYFQLRARLARRGRPL